jgi:Domain of unknown function (DUF5710)
MSRTYLYVPHEERIAVQELGAQWDVDGKCWYIDSALDPTPFGRWLESSPPLVDGTYSIVSDQAYLLTAKSRCWRCHADIKVVCVYCASGRIDGEPYEQFSVSNITAIDASLARQLEGLRDFRFGQARVAGGRYLTNHCRRCGTQQADYHLHCEPSGVFFSLNDAAVGALEITPLVGRVRLCGDEGFEP